LGAGRGGISWVDVGPGLTAFGGAWIWAGDGVGAGMGVGVDGGTRFAPVARKWTELRSGTTCFGP
jgi:hypothetical protein